MLTMLDNLNMLTIVGRAPSIGLLSKWGSDHMPVFTPSTPHLHILTFICSPNSLLYTCATPVYLNGSPSCTMKNFMTGAFKWQNLETRCTLASTEVRLVTTLCLFQRKRGPKGLWALWVKRPFLNIRPWLLWAHGQLLHYEALWGNNVISATTAVGSNDCKAINPNFSRDNFLKNSSMERITYKAGS